MSKLTKLEVGPTFDNIACWTCPVQTKCEAGIFMDEVEAVGNDLPAIMETGSVVVSELGDAPLPGTEDIDEITTELAKVLKTAKERQDDTIAAGTVFVRKLVEAQNIEPGKALTQEEIHQPLIEEFVEAPFDSSKLDLGTERLTSIANSVIHYADTGVCGAISVEQVS